MQLAVGDLVGRFIPTRVGNTCNWRFAASSIAVHPHACGEYTQQLPLRFQLTGSSPRVWGIHIQGRYGAYACRFIPTRVGNTFQKAGEIFVRSVHPHACGEYDAACRELMDAAGSSPRVWGIPVSAGTHHTSRRFIPTRVGNTHPAADRFHRSPVHPHACGEYGALSSVKSMAIGSSPRVWGIPGLEASGTTVARFIPTRVGNTLQEDARNNRLLAELQRATEPCVLQACSDDDKKGKELCKAAPSPRKTLPGRAVTLS